MAHVSALSTSARTRSLIAAAALLAASLVIVAPQRAHAATATPASLAQRLNAIRVGHHLPRLTVRAQLTRSATRHSVLMSKHAEARPRFAGEPSLHDQMVSAGYRPDVALQTIRVTSTAAGLAGIPASLLAHSIARAKLLDKHTSAVGIAIVHRGRWYVTVDYASPQTAAQRQARIARSVLTQLNAERKAHGRHPLTMNADLVSSATAHNRDMARTNDMSHQLSGEAPLGTRISRTGYNWSWAGENIGWTSERSQAGARSIESAMYNEKPPNDGHRLNILSSHYTNAGIAIYIDAKHGKLWLTEDFASH